MNSPAQTPERILQRLDWEVIRRLDGLLQGALNVFCILYNEK
jgi:hypothetical protein